MFAPLKFFYRTAVLLPRKCWYLAVFKCTRVAVGVYLSVTCGLRAHWLQHERPSLSCCHDRFVCLCVWLRCPQVRPRDSALTFDLFAWQNLCFSCISAGLNRIWHHLWGGFSFLLVLLPVFSFFSLLTDAQQSMRCIIELLLKPTTRGRPAWVGF